MALQRNIFVRLHKWAFRQDENFLTESFVFILETLIEDEPEAAAEIVRRITGGIIELPAHNIRSLEIRTQVSGEEGIPDIQLRTIHHFVIIEVKSEAVPTEDQLLRYRQRVAQAESPQKGLVLLTRYPATISGADHNIRWYQIAEWLEQESRNYVFKPTSRFLVDQFLGFLNARNMTMSQITWELPTGVRSMRTLADMLYESAIACGLKAKIVGTSEWMGIKIEDYQYWAGIQFANPENLVFGTNYANVDPNAAKELELGSVYQDNGFGWRREINLESEDVHFFARSKASQMQFLEQFLKENYDLAKSVTVSSSNVEIASMTPDE